MATRSILCAMLAYMEAVLKSAQGQSLWLKNVQLSAFSMVFAAAACAPDFDLSGVDALVLGCIEKEGKKEEK